MGNNCSSKICETPRKNIPCRAQSEDVINMKQFSECFLGNFAKVFRTLYKKITSTRSWNSTIAFTAKIWQTITGISVIFIIRNSVPQLHIYFCGSSFQSFGLSLSMTAILWVWALLCALDLRRLLIDKESWLQLYHRRMQGLFQAIFDTG